MDLRQSTSAVIPFGPFLDKTDGVTLETGLVTGLDHASTGIMLSKNGGTHAVRSATVTASTYDAHGCYRVTLSTTDTGTLGRLRVIYTDAATCLPVWQDFMVLPAQVWDSLYGTDALQVHAVEISAGLITAASIAADAITAAKIADGAIDAATFAAGAINAAAIAADAITDAKVAADVTIASVTGAVGSVTGNVGGNVGGNVVGSVGSLAAQAKADVNAEVLDVQTVDTRPEPGQGTPPDTASTALKIDHIYKRMINKMENDNGTADKFYNAAGTVVDQRQTTSVVAGVITRGPAVSGP